MLDSGCTQHMTGDPKMFSSFDDNVVGYSDIIFGDNGRGKIKEIGTIAISSDHSLSKVLLVDSLKFNLLAVTMMLHRIAHCKVPLPQEHGKVRKQEWEYRKIKSSIYTDMVCV